MNIHIVFVRNIFSGMYLQGNTLVRSVKELCPPVDIPMEERKMQRQRDRRTNSGKTKLDICIIRLVIWMMNIWGRFCAMLFYLEYVPC
jgi:hypothetical protein